MANRAELATIAHMLRGARDALELANEPFDPALGEIQSRLATLLNDLRAVPILPAAGAHRRARHGHLADRHAAAGLGAVAVARSVAALRAGAIMAGRPRLLSEIQLSTMAELREEGWTIRRIQSHFAAIGVVVSHGALSWQCLRLGADLPPAQRRHARPGTYQRNGRPVRAFSPAEDEQLQALEATGKTVHEMSTIMGRRENSIRGRLMILARRQARAEDEPAGVAPAGQPNPIVAADSAAGTSITRPEGDLRAGRSTKLDRGA